MVERIARRQTSPPLSVAPDGYSQQEEERFRSDVMRAIQDGVQGKDLPEIVTPATLSVGGANNYDPGISLRSGDLILRLTTAATGATNLSGFAGGEHGRVLRVTRIGGATALNILNQNTGSLAANRVIVPGIGIGISLIQDGWVDMTYDAVSSRWRVTGYLGVLIDNNDIAALANIDVSKLAKGTALQIFQTDSAGTGVEWSSNLDIPGFARAQVFLEDQITTLQNNATPNVLNRQIFKTGGTTTITDFDDGAIGQRLTILAEHTVTITHNASIIVLAGSVNYGMTTGDTLMLQMFNDQIWHEISRSVA